MVYSDGSVSEMQLLECDSHAKKYRKISVLRPPLVVYQSILLKVLIVVSWNGKKDLLLADKFLIGEWS